MNLNLKRITVIITTLILSSCGKESELSKQISKLNPSAPTEEKAETLMPIGIHSLDDLTTFFNRVNYSLESWQSGNRAVPRVIFSTVPVEWQTGSKHMPVNDKKTIFFKLMLPLILIANEEIKAEQQIAMSASLTSSELLVLTKKYKLTNKSVQTTKLTEEVRQQLLLRIGEIPPSLALAQAAEESGWATSRFTVEGNAFFGQWDFSGKGMKPKHQRKELGDYGLARFDSPLDSVRGYMLNVNTGRAYEQFRIKRANLTKQNKSITGLALATTLDKYSERGQAYVESISSLIKYNKLQSTDDGFLSGNITYQLLTEANSSAR